MAQPAATLIPFHVRFKAQMFREVTRNSRRRATLERGFSTTNLSLAVGGGNDQR
jgi:hypothetical protein